MRVFVCSRHTVLSVLLLLFALLLLFFLLPRAISAKTAPSEPVEIPPAALSLQPSAGGLSEQTANPAVPTVPEAETPEPETPEPETPVSLPILMYHSVLRDPARTGDYIVTPMQMEADFRWLIQHGYTSVTLNALIDYVDRGTPLPQKPVLITLDDGYLNNRTYVLPLLEKYGFHAVISIVGKFTDTFSETPDPAPAYAHLTWDDIRALSATGFIEFGNHTYDMHKQTGRHGSKKNTDESETHYKQAFYEDVSKNQTLLLQKAGVDALVFTYPYGQISPEALPILRQMGFRAAFTCLEQVNSLTRDPEALFHLNRFNRSGRLSTEAFMQKMELS